MASPGAARALLAASFLLAAQHHAAAQPDLCPPRFASSRKPPIPNAVHQPWLSGATLRWEHVLAMMSVRYVLRPERYTLYVDRVPAPSATWRCALALVDELALRPARTRVGATPILHTVHQSDLMRLELLLAHGGVYLDHDAFALQPLDGLRACGADVIAGYERYWDAARTEKLNNGVLLARPRAPFLRRWQAAYSRGYYPHSWDNNSCVLPFRLASEHPEEALVLRTPSIGPMPPLLNSAPAHAHYQRRALVTHVTGLLTERWRVAEVRQFGVLRAIAERVLGAAGRGGGVPGPRPAPPDALRTRLLAALLLRNGTAARGGGGGAAAAAEPPAETPVMAAERHARPASARRRRLARGGDGGGGGEATAAGGSVDAETAERVAAAAWTVEQWCRKRVRSHVRQVW